MRHYNRNRRYEKLLIGLFAVIFALFGFLVYAEVTELLTVTAFMCVGIVTLELLFIGLVKGLIYLEEIT